MNTPTSFLTIAVSMLLGITAQAHTFTLADGSKVEAQITAIANGQITVAVPWASSDDEQDNTFTHNSSFEQPWPHSP